MRIFGRGRLDDCMRRHAETRGPLAQWVRDVEKAQWDDPVELKNDHPTADPLKAGRAVFNILGEALSCGGPDRLFSEERGDPLRRYS